MADLIRVTNPYTGEEIGQVPSGTAADIDEAVRAAQQTAKVLFDMELGRRALLLNEAAETLYAETESLCRLLASESGKTVREARGEVQRTANIFIAAAEETNRLHGETIPFDSMLNGFGRTGYWVREPIGIVGAITPWNVPLALAAHKIAPAIGAGNAVILKPAEQTPLSTLRLAEIINGHSPDLKLVHVVTGTGAEAGDALVRHPDVPFLSFTGSREVGMQMPARAGFKKVTLELGGNSPVIIAPSANLEEATTAIVRGGFTVAGQLCISVQRVIAHESILPQLQDLIVRRVAMLKVGDPMDDSTDVGTLIDSNACDRVEREVQAAIAAGANVLIGGTRLSATQFAPTVLEDITPDSPIAISEAFAPLLLLLPYITFDEAIAIANATPYGLNAGIYTNDLSEAFRAAKEIVAGSVMINDVPTFRSDIMPYGGRKQSGLGREGVRFAMEEMTEIKVVCFKNV